MRSPTGSTTVQLNILGPGYQDRQLYEGRGERQRSLNNKSTSLGPKPLIKVVSYMKIGKESIGTNLNHESRLKIKLMILRA